MAHNGDNIKILGLLEVEMHRLVAEAGPHVIVLSPLEVNVVTFAVTGVAGAISVVVVAVVEGPVGVPRRCPSGPLIRVQNIFY